MALKVYFLFVLIATIAFVDCYPADSSEESPVSSDRADAPAYTSDDQTKTTIDSSESVEKRSLNDPTVKPTTFVKGDYGNSQGLQVPPSVEIGKDTLLSGRKQDSSSTSTTSTTTEKQHSRVQREVTGASTPSTSTVKVSTTAPTGKVSLVFTGSTLQHTQGDNKNGGDKLEPVGLGILPPKIHQ